MRTKLLFKSLLVAAGLCAGQSAWADETLVWSMNFADVSTSNSSTIVNFTSNGDYVKVGQDGWNYNSTYATETGTHFAWARQRSDSKTYGFCFRNSAVFCQSTSYAMTIIGLKENYKVTVNTSANAIASSFKGNTGGTWTSSVNDGKTTYTYTMTSDGDLNLMVAVGAYINSVSVVELSGVEATKYTVKYQNAGGTDLKAPVEYDTYVGETFTASASDMAAFYSDDTNTKYVYASGNTSTTAVATASSNVITLVFNEYSKVAYTVTAKNGEETLGTLASGDAYTDGSTTAKWNKYKQFDDKWYVTTGSYGKEITEAGNTDVAYTASDIAYFVEIENISKSRSAAGNKTGNNFSNGEAQRHYASSTWYTEEFPEGGVFTLSFPYQLNSTSGSTLYIGTADADGSNFVSVETFTVANSSPASTYENTITIPAGKALAIQANEYNSNILIDYLTLTKVTAVSATIPTSTYGTIASAYALDCANLPAGLEAYKVKSISASAVTLEQVTEAVAAGTGLILKGTASTPYKIPVVASGSDISATNKLQAAVTDTPIAADEAYILQGGLFHLVNAASTVPAGKAYLLASDVPSVSGDARSLNFVFDEGETTGINEELRIKNEESSAAPVYNLNGQRVAQPTRGLYIVNGKKVLVP